MKQPKVSVIVLTYNSADTVEQALDSVLSQKCSFEYEILIGDDGSTDGTQDILRRYRNKYPDIIRLFIAGKNRGVQANYFDCFEQCRADYIADCAADDYWPDTCRLQKLVDCLDNAPDAAMVFSNWLRIGPDSAQAEVCLPAVTRDAKPGELTEPLLSVIGSTAVHLSAAIYRKSSVVDEYAAHRDDLYRNRAYGCEDQQLMVALSRAGRCVYLPEATLAYRTGHASITSEADHIKAARFSLATIRLRLHLRERYGLTESVPVALQLQHAYHFALANAATSGDKNLINDILSLWQYIPRKRTRTYALKAILRMPGGKRLFSILKSLRS